MGIQPRTLYVVSVSRFLLLLAASCDIEEVGGEEGVGRKDLHMDRFPPITRYFRPCTEGRLKERQTTYLLISVI